MERPSLPLTLDIAIEGLFTATTPGQLDRRKIVIDVGSVKTVVTNRVLDTGVGDDVDIGWRLDYQFSCFQVIDLFIGHFIVLSETYTHENTLSSKFYTFICNLINLLNIIILH